MKSIRATVDLNGRATLAFGYDKELVELVKDVSGFSWDKVKRQWSGPFHALAALDYATKKRGDCMMIVSWPNVMAPPFVIEGERVKLKEFQRWAAGVLSQRREFLLSWDPRVGKAQPFDAKVLTPSGWCRIGDLEAGDLVISPSTGRAVPVTGVFPQGVRDVYRVETSDGASTECCAEHLWTVQTHKLKITTGNSITYPLSRLIERGTKMSDGRHRWYLPLCVPPVFDFDRHDIGLEPYLLGALLGNGSFNHNGTVGFTSADAEIVTRVRRSIPLGDELRQRGVKTNEFSIATNVPGRTAVATFIERVGLRSKEAHEKFVPREFFLTSSSDRLALLQGLLDTDGDTPANSSTVVFNSASEQLRNDVVELVCSLGGFASKSVREEPHFPYKGELRTGRPSYRAYIRMPCNPFSLSRKARDWRLGPLVRGIESVTLVGRKPVLCISVGSKDGLYVTDGYIVTHNTTVVIHAGATGIAARSFDRVFLFPPANVTSEWRRQIDNAFPGMTFAELEGTPLDTPERAQRRVAREGKKIAEASVKLAESAAKKFVKAAIRFLVKNGRLATLGDVPPVTVASVEKVAEKETAAKVKHGADYEKAVAAENAMVANAKNAHFVSCQHDLISPRAETLAEIAAIGPFALCIDEVQFFVDEKSPRAKALVELTQHPNCRKVWCTTGTVMRSRPEDLVVFYQLMGGIGAKWGFLKRYAEAKVNDQGFWESEGEANLDELAARLGSISHRLRREDVRPDLPSLVRSVKLCPMTREEGQRYKALEAALGKKALSGKREADIALRTLVTSIAATKWRTALERVVVHATRGVKTLVAAAYHESLKSFEETARATFPGAPIYCAGGWLPPEKRAEVITAWRTDARPAVLLVNIISSGVGIDLSDADGTIVVEVTHVPSDMLQLEARILDVHLGKRTTQPWIEYILAAGTVDEDMALSTLKKLGAIDTVVGASKESIGLASALRDSGVVSQVDLGLVDKSDSSVEAALDGLRRRLAGEVEIAPENGLGTAALLGAVEEAYDDDEGETDDERDERAANRTE